MKRAIPAIIALLVLVAFAGTLAYLWNKAREPAEVFETETAEVRDIVRKTVATGSVVPRREIEIKSRVSGIVGQLHVEPGDRVAEGDLVAIIRVVPDAGSLARAEAAVADASAAHAQAQRELVRAESLAEKGAISPQEIDRLRTDALRARHAAQAARTDLRIVREGAIAGSKTAPTEIRSTVNGMVLEVPVEIGASVIEANPMNEGTTIATVADMEDLIFLGRVDESEVGRIAPGMALQVTIGAHRGQRFAGTLEHIAPKGMDQEGSIQFEVRASITPPEELFIRAGLSANADIVLERRDEVLAVREALLVFQGSDTFVEVEVAPQRFEARQVALGLSDGLWAEVIEGISGDDRLKRRSRGR